MGVVEIDDRTEDTQLAAVQGVDELGTTPPELAIQKREVGRAPEAAVVRDPPKQERVREVVLSDGAHLFNTGVWPGWGSPDPEEAQLQWAASGVTVRKPCPFQCRFRHGDHRGAGADLALLESVNHPKFGHTAKPFPWPRKPADARLVGVFYVEPEGAYPQFDLTADAVRSRADLSVTYTATSDVRVTLMCPWGVPPATPQAEAAFGPLAAAYLQPAPLETKRTDGAVALFSDRGVAPVALRRLHSLAERMGQQLHTYSPPAGLHRHPLPSGYEQALQHLPDRLRLLGTYRVALVAQSSLDEDWLDPELSHALVAGAVPVVWGASNVKSLMPADEAFIDANAFGDDVDALWSQVRRVLEDDAEYERRQNWRKQVLTDIATAPKAADGKPRPHPQSAAARFARFAANVADNCVHYAECRICREVVQRTPE